uniref:Uncharacterized protein n=1 Tax=Romanomermis culicivorax TaxID=13658 RepID=A0A915KIG7_ROMCU
MLEPGKNRIFKKDKTTSMEFRLYLSKLSKSRTLFEAWKTAETLFVRKFEQLAWPKFPYINTNSTHYWLASCLFCYNQNYCRIFFTENITPLLICLIEESAHRGKTRANY